MLGCGPAAAAPHPISAIAIAPIDRLHLMARSIVPDQRRAVSEEAGGSVDGPPSAYG